VIPGAFQVPPGRWSVAVSGGADSVALLHLLHDRRDLFLHVVHLDHQTRGQASADDARFVFDLSARLSLASTLSRRDEIEPQMTSLPKNLSARYRAIRIELFRRVVAHENLLGVILAHQADDQAETIFLRLLRGSGPAGLAGMSPRRQISGLTMLRPLLNVRRSELREFLAARGQTWREDASNQSDRYARNRVRKFLDSRQDLHDLLLALGRTCARYRQWIGQNAPKLEARFPAKILADLPRMLGRESARRWLVSQGQGAADLPPDVLDRLREMAADAATPKTQLFPAHTKIGRRRGWITRQ
jgi:tRNA(Ile)-lysidine synthase